MKTKPAAMTLDDLTRELAAGLRDVVHDIPDSHFKEDPEEAFIDVAVRLLFRLRATLTVVPVRAAKLERIEQAERDAASRTLGILTKWLKAAPGRSIETRVSASGKVQVVVKTPETESTRLHFGESVQDAYAQAAQTIDFE